MFHKKLPFYNFGLRISRFSSVNFTKQYFNKATLKKDALQNYFETFVYNVWKIKIFIEPQKAFFTNWFLKTISDKLLTIFVKTNDFVLDNSFHLHYRPFQKYNDCFHMKLSHFVWVCFRKSICKKMFFMIPWKSRISTYYRRECQINFEGVLFLRVVLLICCFVRFTEKKSTYS